MADKRGSLLSQIESKEIKIQGTLQTTFVKQFHKNIGTFSKF